MFRSSAPLPVPLALVASLAIVAPALGAEVAPSRVADPLGVSDASRAESAAAERADEGENVSAGANAEPAPSSQHYALRAEVGSEVDTNAHRRETVQGAVDNTGAVVSPVGRVVVAGSLSDVVGDGHQVALSATVAGKVFTNTDARSENVAIVDGSALWRKALAPRWALALSSAYYEAFQGDGPNFGIDRRDFRSFTPTLRLARTFGDSVDAGVGGGYRLFVFKPDHSFDFQAPTAVLDARWARETADGAAEWDVSVRASYERRFYSGRQLVETTACTPQPCPPTTGLDLRRDHFLTSALDVSRTGRVLLGAGYGLFVNRSNSFGETVLRHFLTARFAAALPLELYLAARVEILVARYADPQFLAPGPMAGSPFVSIEDENRNSARVELSRNFGERLQLIARYTFYANELQRDTNVNYRRQTALLSLAFTLEK